MSPVVIFCYNRLHELKRMIASLLANYHASDAKVFIYCDGPKNATDKAKTDELRQFVETIRGFKSITIRTSNANRGLAPSIIKGVSEVIEQYGRAIVLEDDLILSKNFLDWMNQCLDKYENEDKVFSISGFSPRTITIKDYPYDGFFTRKAHSWGWATWKDRWVQVDWELKDWHEFESNRKLQKQFNELGNEMSGLLFDYVNGKKSSWWVRFCYSQFKLNKLTIYPKESKIINSGFTSEATHCNVYNRYKVDFDISGKHTFSLPLKPEEHKQLSKSFYATYSLKARIIGKIKTYMLRMGVIEQYTVTY